MKNDGFVQILGRGSGSGQILILGDDGAGRGVGQTSEGGGSKWGQNRLT